MPITRPPSRAKRDDDLHDRREARHRAGAQVVAVGEAARQDDAVDARAATRSLCHSGHDRLAEHLLERVDGVADRRAIPETSPLPSASPPLRSVADLEPVVLDHAVGEQLAGTCRRGARSPASASPSISQLEVLPKPHVARPREAERVQRALDRLAGRIEDPGLRGHVDLRSHASPPPSYRRRPTTLRRPRGPASLRLATNRTIVAAASVSSVCPNPSGARLVGVSSSTSRSVHPRHRRDDHLRDAVAAPHDEIAPCPRLTSSTCISPR